MSNIEYPSVIKFFTRKDLNTTEISKKLDNVYKDDAPSYRTVVKWITEFKESTRAFEDSPRTDRLSTITIDQNIEVIERIVMCDRQVSVRHLVYKLTTPTTTTTVYDIMSNHLGMKKVSTRSVPNTYSTC